MESQRFPQSDEDRQFLPFPAADGAAPKKKRRPFKLPDFLHPHQEQQLLAAAAGELARCKIGTKRQGPCASKIAAAERDLFTVQFGLMTGLRVPEMTDLTLQNIDLVAREVRVKKGKNSKDRIVPIGDALLAPLTAWIGARADGYLLPSRRGGRVPEITLYWRLVRLGKIAKLPSLHPHTLRHTFATRLYEATDDLLIVKELLGHESIATTQIYAHCAMRRKLRAVNLIGLAVP